MQPTLERIRDQEIQRDDEFSDSEDEGEGGRRNESSNGTSKSRISKTSQRPSQEPPRQVGIMEGMKMEVDDELPESADEQTSAQPAPPALATAPTPAALAAEQKEDVDMDLTPQNFPAVAKGEQPDIRMDGPPSSIRDAK